MNLVLPIILLAILLMIGLFAAARSQRRPITSLDDLQARWTPVDLHALLNLVDPKQESYLRETLSSRDFNFIRRKRLIVTWGYLSRLGANARLMVQAGQIIQHSSRLEQALEAHKLVNDSMRLRAMVLKAQFSVASKFILPGVASPLTAVVDQYSQVQTTLDQACSQRKIHAVSNFA